MSAGSIYSSLTRIHRLWRGRNPVKSLPILVIGSLRAGGGGKTPVVSWFAERMPDAAILVHPTPDEQVLLERRFPGRVIAGRSFPRAWAKARQAGFSRAICDGGFQDPRLDGGLRLLVWDDPAPEADASMLLPFGPWRELARAAERADLLAVREGLGSPSVSLTSHSYGWESKWPGEIASGSVLLACGVGNPDRVRCDLQELGAEVRAEHVVSDHGTFDPKEIARLERCFPEIPWIGTEKDRPRWPIWAKPLHLLLRTWHPTGPNELLQAVRAGLDRRAQDA